ncbi:MAG: hypothetical protein HYU28_09420 [Actinobacteria bacterium]|nr:hypothetical protein [Actinomycetota bacterium]
MVVDWGRRLPVAGVLLSFALVVWSAPAQAERGVSFEASVNEHDVAAADANRPAPLRPRQPITLEVTITNRTGDDVLVRSVRLSGTIVGLTFLAYEVRADIAVASGATERRAFEIDPADLGAQAVGLVPARLELLDADRGVIAAEEFTVDVRGSLTSVLGVFAAGVAAVTAVLLVTALVRLAGHRLPATRWRRGLRFAAPGFGLGLTGTFTLSVFRFLTPERTLWLPLVAGGGVAFFVFGYLTPRPRGEEEEADELDEDLAAVAAARESASVAAVAENPPAPEPPPSEPPPSEPALPAPEPPEPPPSAPGPPPGRSTIVTNEPLPPPP